MKRFILIEVDRLRGVFRASRGLLRQALAGNLGAGNQIDVAVENGLCDADEARHYLRIVVGVHGGPIEEPLIGGEDGRGVLSQLPGRSHRVSRQLAGFS